MNKLFQSSTSIFRSLFNSIVALSSALENFSKVSLIKSEMKKIDVEAEITDKIEDTEEFLEKINAQYQAARERSKFPIILTLVLFAFLIVVF